MRESLVSTPHEYSALLMRRMLLAGHAEGELQSSHWRRASAGYDMSELASVTVVSDLDNAALLGALCAPLAAASRHLLLQASERLSASELKLHVCNHGHV